MFECKAFSSSTTSCLQGWSLQTCAGKHCGLYFPGLFHVFWSPCMFGSMELWDTVLTLLDPTCLHLS